MHHVAKLRLPAEENGLVPAGAYFQRLANALRQANERQARRRVRVARPSRDFRA